MASFVYLQRSGVRFIINWMSDVCGSRLPAFFQYIRMSRCASLRPIYYKCDIAVQFNRHQADR